MNDISKSFEALYKETGNPIYAAATLVYLGDDEPIPPRVREWACEVACAIFALAHDKELDLDEKPARLASALNLVSQGKNEFKNYEKDGRLARLASDYDQAIVRAGQGASEGIVHDLVKRLRRDRSSVLRQIKRGRRLFEVQRTDP